MKGKLILIIAILLLVFSIAFFNNQDHLGEGNQLFIDDSYHISFEYKTKWKNAENPYPGRILFVRKFGEGNESYLLVGMDFISNEYSYDLDKYIDYNISLYEEIFDEFSLISRYSTTFNGIDYIVVSYSYGNGKATTYVTQYLTEYKRLAYIISHSSDQRLSYSMFNEDNAEIEELLNTVEVKFHMYEMLKGSFSGIDIIDILPKILLFFIIYGFYLLCRIVFHIISKKFHNISITRPNETNAKVGDVADKLLTEKTNGEIGKNNDI